MTYWKHRLLHTRLFFPFHKHHHSFRDPTPFAGFAVGPLETLLTFWPLLLICFPPAKHFAPLYFSAIVGFVFLNLYLHCGVTFNWMEKLLPRIGLNTSAWHNVHHSDVNANFGEVSSIWDKVCKTSRRHVQAKKKPVTVTA
jgi:lathosterol oxidase